MRQPRRWDASAPLAEQIGTPREIWIARSALGGVTGKLGRDNEAEAQFVKAADAIEDVTSKLKTRASEPQPSQLQKRCAQCTRRWAASHRCQSPERCAYRRTPRLTVLVGGSI